MRKGSVNWENENLIATTERCKASQDPAEQSYDVARGLDRYVCLWLHLGMVHLSDWVYWCLLLYGKVKHQAAYPSSHSGNRNGLYVSAVGLLETIQFKAQGTKTHLVCKDHSLLRYNCTCCTHWSSVPLRALQCTTAWKQGVQIQV